MATKKKARKIKKNKGKKKSIDLTFSTSKKEFANEIIVLQNQQILFDRCQLTDIEQEMEKYHIHINRKEVIKKYELCFQVETIINEYYLKYEQQFNHLDQLNLLFDETCIIFYVHKLIEDNYVINEIPDKYYIIQACEYFMKLPEAQIPAYFLTLMTTINRLKDYNDERNISELFDKYDYDIEWTLSDAICMYVHNCQPDLDMTRKITDEVFQFINHYKLEHPEYLYGDSLEILASHGYDVVKDRFEVGLKLYPENRFRLYNSVISELAYNDKQKDEAIRIYNEFLKLQPVSQDDKDYLEFMPDNFNHLQR